MDLYEEAVIWYVTASRTRFVSPQFSLPWEQTAGGTCPDFVVIDYEKQKIYVIEVSSGAEIDGLFERLAERENRWLNPLRKHFSDLSGHFNDWKFHVTVFVRSEVVDNLLKRVASWSDV